MSARASLERTFFHKVKIVQTLFLIQMDFSVIILYLFSKLFEHIKESLEDSNYMVYLTIQLQVSETLVV